MSHVQEAVRGDDARQAEAAPGRAAHHADQVAAPSPGRLRQPARVDEAHRAVGDVAVAVPRLRRPRIPHQRIRAQEPAQRPGRRPAPRDGSAPSGPGARGPCARACAGPTSPPMRKSPPGSAPPSSPPCAGRRTGRTPAFACARRPRPSRPPQSPGGPCGGSPRGSPWWSSWSRHPRRDTAVVFTCRTPSRHPRLPDRRVRRARPRQQLLERADVVRVFRAQGFAVHVGRLPVVARPVRAVGELVARRRPGGVTVRAGQLLYLLRRDQLTGRGPASRREPPASAAPRALLGRATPSLPRRAPWTSSR